MRPATIDPKWATRLRTSTGTDRSLTGAAGMVLKPSSPLTPPKQFPVVGRWSTSFWSPPSSPASRCAICGTTSTAGTPRGRGPRPMSRGRSTDWVTTPPSRRTCLLGSTRPTGTTHPAPVLRTTPGRPSSFQLRSGRTCRRDCRR